MTREEAVWICERLYPGSVTMHHSDRMWTPAVDYLLKVVIEGWMNRDMPKSLVEEYDEERAKSLVFLLDRRHDTRRI